MIPHHVQGMGPKLGNPDDRRLFGAQLVALSGTGLMTGALGLLAYDLAGAGAGALLSTVFTVKMIAYVGLCRRWRRHGPCGCRARRC